MSTIKIEFKEDKMNTTIEGLNVMQLTGAMNHLLKECINYSLEVEKESSRNLALMALIGGITEALVGSDLGITEAGKREIFTVLNNYIMVEDFNILEELSNIVI